jgi:hypothetical protein
VKQYLGPTLTDSRSSPGAEQASKARSVRCEFFLLDFELLRSIPDRQVIICNLGASQLQITTPMKALKDAMQRQRRSRYARTR